MLFFQAYFDSFVAVKINYTSFSHLQNIHLPNQ